MSCPFLRSLAVPLASSSCKSVPPAPASQEFYLSPFSRCWMGKRRVVGRGYKVILARPLSSLAPGL